MYFRRGMKVRWLKATRTNSPAIVPTGDAFVNCTIILYWNANRRGFPAIDVATGSAIRRRSAG
jgi:hypothetical protein